ncbi:MAG: Tn3 family transposase, partial [Acetobacteraceae bacterium]|nr:Tn3 family transposase [Acetobacteraceae bacterium]
GRGHQHGPDPDAEACSLATYRQLAWHAGWYLREDTYRPAIGLVADMQHRQLLAALFGAADVSSSDGQHFITAGQAEALGAHNAHYGQKRSALIYTHTSARHAPYHAVAIPPAGEAAYVIDGVLYHEADLSILTHHAFGPASTWPALAPFIAGRPEEKLIEAHWDDVLRLTCSVRTGVVSASLMLKRLGAYPRQNGLALALREVGRIERTLHTLDWIELPPLRRQATTELNKGESRHALARAVAFHPLGRLRDRTARFCSTGRARWHSLPGRLPCGTPCSSAERSKLCAPVAKRFQTRCWPTSPHPAGSTSPYRRLPLGR